MLKKTIKYTDFNDEEVEETFFFHLSQAELVELEMSHEGGLQESLQNIVAAQDGQAIIKEFKNIILTAYGQKSPDGRRFIKNQQLRDEFESSEAYSTLFMDLIMNVDSAIEFVQGIIPKGLSDQAAKVINTDERALAPVPEPPELPEARVITVEEFRKMDAEELSEIGQKIASGEITIAE